MKVTISKIFIADEEIKTRHGSAKKVGIKIQEPTVELVDGGTSEVADRWIYGFLNKTIQGWSNGDIVEINVSERESNGKHYLNFKLGGASLEDRVKKLEDAVFGARQSDETVIQTEDNDEPEF